MSNYKAVIRGADFYTFIVRVDRDGEETVIHGYKSRFFATRKAAEKSTAAYIEKHCAVAAGIDAAKTETVKLNKEELEMQNAILLAALVQARNAVTGYFGQTGAAKVVIDDINSAIKKAGI